MQLGISLGLLFPKRQRPWPLNDLDRPVLMDTYAELSVTHMELLLYSMGWSSTVTLLAT